MLNNKCIPYSQLTDFDIDLFRSGNHFRLYEKMGSHPVVLDEIEGFSFAVYAPGAHRVEVIGDFNGWNGNEHSLFVRWDHSGVWEGFIPGIKEGTIYKYRIYSHHDDRVREKADPFAFHTEQMPKSASVCWSIDYDWQDERWISERSKKNSLDSPISIYELHLGSWKKNAGFSLGYSEMAGELVEYVMKMGFTHVEFLPLTEHPFYPSWGYLSTSYFAPTSRYGTPQELMFLINALHNAGIGVIMDWVPAHFPSDDFALADFDGTKLYEHPDRKRGYHPDWNSLIFNYERPEIVSFLISSAHFWLGVYHMDGLRVDAVSSMLYLDYSREEGEWEANIYGGNEYLAAIDFVKKLNSSCYQSFPDIQMIAEESTAFNGVSRPIDLGGLGFGVKWMMGWMNDTLVYMSRDPIHRPFHHNEISFSMAYYYSENFMLPISHDEVVHGKNSIAYKMPGDEWQRFANLRLLYAYMFTHPGQKLLFMGCEIGQTSEWEVNESVSWHLLEFDPHKGLQSSIKKLNRILREEKPMYAKQFQPESFEWIDHSDHKNCILAYLRKSGDECLVVVCNFQPVAHEHYRLGVPDFNTWECIFNSDDPAFWGSGFNIQKKLNSEDIDSHGRNKSVNISIPPLAVLIYKPTE
ncbi:MAG: 1,4-alpha-glucan branching protein GlgB [Saprospiraceae bacterium]|nr:1,4-alpha-glucan branching protein GlgB [Saprospiraceae bacterium]